MREGMEQSSSLLWAAALNPEENNNRNYGDEAASASVSTQSSPSDSETWHDPLYNNLEHVEHMQPSHLALDHHSSSDDDDDEFFDARSDFADEDASPEAGATATKLSMVVESVEDGDTPSSKDDTDRKERSVQEAILSGNSDEPTMDQKETGEGEGDESGKPGTTMRRLGNVAANGKQASGGVQTIVLGGNTSGAKARTRTGRHKKRGGKQAAEESMRGDNMVGLENGRSSSSESPSPSSSSGQREQPLSGWQGWLRRDDLLLSGFYWFNFLPEMSVKQLCAMCGVAKVSKVTVAQTELEQVDTAQHALSTAVALLHDGGNSEAASLAGKLETRSVEEARTRVTAYVQSYQWLGRAVELAREQGREDEHTQDEAVTALLLRSWVLLQLCQAHKWTTVPQWDMALRGCRLATQDCFAARKIQPDAVDVRLQELRCLASLGLLFHTVLEELLDDCQAKLVQGECTSGKRECMWTTTYMDTVCAKLRMRMIAATSSFAGSRAMQLGSWNAQKLVEAGLAGLEQSREPEVLRESLQQLHLGLKLYFGSGTGTSSGDGSDQASALSLEKVLTRMRAVGSDLPLDLLVDRRIDASTGKLVCSMSALGRFVWEEWRTETSEHALETHCLDAQCIELFDEPLGADLEVVTREWTFKLSRGARTFYLLPCEVYVEPLVASSNVSMRELVGAQAVPTEWQRKNRMVMLDRSDSMVQELVCGVLLRVLLADVQHVDIGLRRQLLRELLRRYASEQSKASLGVFGNPISGMVATVLMMIVQRGEEESSGSAGANDGQGPGREVAEVLAQLMVEVGGAREAAQLFLRDNFIRYGLVSAQYLGGVEGACWADSLDAEVVHEVLRLFVLPVMDGRLPCHVDALAHSTINALPSDEMELHALMCVVRMAAREDLAELLQGFRAQSAFATFACTWMELRGQESFKQACMSWRGMSCAQRFVFEWSRLSEWEQGQLLASVDDLENPRTSPEELVEASATRARVCGWCGCGEGKLMACGGCGREWYCRKDCAQRAWRAGHGRACKKGKKGK